MALEEGKAWKSLWEKEIELKGAYMGGEGTTLITMYRKFIHFHAGFISYKVITDA